MDGERVGWRLTLEPLGTEYVWSLIRQDDAGTHVWAEVIEDATELRTTVENLVDNTDPGAPVALLEHGGRMIDWPHVKSPMRAELEFVPVRITRPLPAA